MTTLSPGINALFQDEFPSADGAIEPLMIRDYVVRKVHLSNVAHRTCGSLEEGNENGRDNSDVFVYIVKRNEMNVGTFSFEDEADTAGNMPIFSEELSKDNRRRGAFDDSQNNNGIITSNYMPNDLKFALLRMNPPSDNYLPSTHVQLGATGIVF
jgi:hypothetical protein